MRPVPTTPFGRRPLSLAMVAAQAAAKACPDDATGHKWRIFRNLTEAKHALRLSDRALAVMSALLTFHPETVLMPGTELIVFPSNRELSLRAHGIAAATLRRALGVLVEAGLVIRRDSPNGKRYARKGQGGAIEHAFGFDLTPLLARAAEFEGLAEAARADAKACRSLREEISLHRRDIAKTIATGLEEAIPGRWADFEDRLRRLGPMPPRSADRSDMEPLAADLSALRLEVEKCLEENTKTHIMGANESQNDPHQQNSNSNPLSESEPDFQESRAAASESAADAPSIPLRTFPLGMVLQACPDIADYARHGISSRQDFLTAAGVVRTALGISPSAWTEACAAMGEEAAAVTVAAILQKGEGVKSPGGYLRNLTQRARAGQYSLGPVIMALLRVRRVGRKRA